mmetsp:Transcript_79555/g.212674  ORF Transcript_79555/g.212674 Transcript_79555/m.212674 type:complete len:235 (+) Transcript_79555:348-1052(+)
MVASAIASSSSCLLRSSSRSCSWRHRAVTPLVAFCSCSCLRRSCSAPSSSSRFRWRLSSEPEAEPNKLGRWRAATRATPPCSNRPSRTCEAVGLSRGLRWSMRVNWNCQVADSSVGIFGTSPLPILKSRANWLWAASPQGFCPVTISMSRQPHAQMSAEKECPVPCTTSGAIHGTDPVMVLAITVVSRVVNSTFSSRFAVPKSANLATPSCSSGAVSRTLPDLMSLWTRRSQCK